MARILVVEDEQSLNDLIARLLRHEGHSIRQAFDGEAALLEVRSFAPELIVLDWMLPKLDGPSVASRIRDDGSLVPIIMLTARAEESDLILGLDAGADEYVTKPFKNRELTARVRAHLRRHGMHQEAIAESVSESPGNEPELHSVGPIAVNMEGRSAFLHHDEIDLTPKEFDLLALFVQNPGRAFSRDYLLERVWGDEVYVNDRTVDTNVQRLRKKLGEEAEMIRTVWGVGYKLQRDG
ncbi:MAG: response regulator transcription factor [Thermomicrobiales bacterium]